MNVTTSGSHSTSGLSSSLSRPTDQSTSARSPLPPSQEDSLSSSDVVHAHRVQHQGFTSESDQTLTYLSVVWHGGTLGLAYFSTETSYVYMMMDTAETEDFQLLRQVLTQVSPSCIITSSKQDEKMLQVLRHKESSVLLSSDVEEAGVQLEVLPSIDFSLEVCKRRILALNLPSIPQHFTESERVIYLSSLVAFENINMVRATGALLKYLDKNRVGVELEDADVRTPVLALKTFSLENIMIIDDSSYSALQIFQKESHPSVYKSGSGAKEGLSLFGIMNRTKSILGSRMMGLWFQRPLQCLQELQQRHDAVEFFASPSHMEVTSSLQDSLKHMKNVNRVLARMRSGQASVGDWQALYKTAYNGIYIGDVCRAQPQHIHIFNRISRQFSDDLHRIATLIHKIVDFEESTVHNRLVVKPHVDPELDEKKRTYNGLPDFMTRVAREELNKLDDSITECNVIYLPQLGYLLAIPCTSQIIKEEEKYHMPGLEFVFLSNGMVHYKSASTRELDALLGDTQCEITDHETSIMHKLQNTILDHATVLLDVMECVAEMDCLIAFASVAKDNNYARPQLSKESGIRIVGGRHPLQELCVSPFVPNNTTLGGKDHRLSVLTGPNASGKSVYLKQVGLIVFLAQVGSFVPAESATIGLVDRIFTRIHTRESVSVGLSTFMIDLNQVSLALRCTTDRSLVLFDEFGKGTATVDGISLMTASLGHLLSRGASCPLTIVSTHFHGLVKQNLLPSSHYLTYQMMETIQDGEQLVFLYQLVDGVADSSYACTIAAQVGLPSELISRGAEVSELIRTNQPVHRVDTASTETQYQRCSEVVEEFLTLDLEKRDLVDFLKKFVSPKSQGNS
ncbi:mutS protein homolog 5-like [Branchiostoma floridae]|uniref:MutS protein homolog 5 n=1 Tax=Branchiostoma floridae TaxID=7739 RepID=A0A9J7NCH6_BRAFL|nr:mutS protein homolog 5-like [Branchiostoma floridae]XP_035698855.1 mutS protein homolog 5-like [Branchiostoma floridae]